MPELLQWVERMAVEARYAQSDFGSEAITLLQVALIQVPPTILLSAPSVGQQRCLDVEYEVPSTPA